MSICKNELGFDGDSKGNRRPTDSGARAPGEQLVRAEHQHESSSAVASDCRLSGMGLTRASVRCMASFLVHHERRLLQGLACSIQPEARGGRAIKIASVTDLADGSHRVTFKPTVAGRFTLLVSLNGVALPGSPTALHVVDATPCVDNCKLRGAGLTEAVARQPSHFEVQFKGARPLSRPPQ